MRESNTKLFQYSPKLRMLSGAIFLMALLRKSKVRMVDRRRRELLNLNPGLCTNMDSGMGKNSSLEIP
jgi:hypothetical protein